MDNNAKVVHATTHTTEQLVSSTFSKVVALMGDSKVEHYVWETAFHRTALDAGVQDKSDLMGCVVSRCMSQLIYSVTVS